MQFDCYLYCHCTVVEIAEVSTCVQDRTCTTQRCRKAMLSFCEPLCRSTHTTNLVSGRVVMHRDCGGAA